MYFQLFHIHPRENFSALLSETLASALSGLSACQQSSSWLLVGIRSKTEVKLPVSFSFCVYMFTCSPRPLTHNYASQFLVSKASDSGGAIFSGNFGFIARSPAISGLQQGFRLWFCFLTLSMYEILVKIDLHCQNCFLFASSLEAPSIGCERVKCM